MKSTASRYLRAAAVFLVLLLGAAAASAVGFTVNDAGDLDDDNPGDHVCHTTAGTCTLRAAITEMNATGGAGIDFNISGAGVHTIKPTSPLPIIHVSLLIDGYSQPGATANTLAVGDNAVLLIELDGSLAGFAATGLTIYANNCTVKGLVINRFRNPGISIDATGGGTLGGNVIQGNFIGTDPTGTVAHGNQGFGVFARSPNTTIGGPNPADRNVISGNGTTAPADFNANVEIDSSFGINSTGSVIRGNYIGMDSTGTVAIPSGNSGNGITIQSEMVGGSGVTVGGTAPGAGNVISGNPQYGIEFRGLTCLSPNSITGVAVQGNLIGTDVEGGPHGNGYGGILIGCGAVNNSIGGTAAGAGNVIAYNGGGIQTGGGVLVVDGSINPTGNAILQNSIFQNTKAAGPVAFGLGIDLSVDGPTVNDAGDGDTGGNNRQNYPVIANAIVSGGSITIQGTLDSAANTSYRIEFFTNTSCDPSGYGEGQQYLGTTPVLTDAGGHAAFSAVIPTVVSVGNTITATATDSLGNTSEFSLCHAVVTNAKFFTLTPCRVIDTRNPTGPDGGPAILSAGSRDFTLAGQCSIPATATAVAVNIAVTQSTNGPGFLTLFPAGTVKPGISSINYSAGQTRANNAIVPVNAAGAITVYCAQGGGTVQLILDVNGYFQ